MNLLPKSFEQFREKEYWDKFFVSRRNSPFEWYGDYAELKSSLLKCMTSTDRLLVVGCGNSKLSADLHDQGFRRITNVDISNVVIKQMKRLHGRKRPNMKWIRADVTQRMPFAEDGAFDVVLDKGTLDALMTSDDAAIVHQVDGMFAEIERTLSVGGRYVCISLLQEHIINQILNWFTNRNKFDVLVRRNEEGKANSSSDSIEFPVFVVICTKCDDDVGQQEKRAKLECSLYDGQSVQTTTKESLQQSVRVLQQYAFVKHDLRQGIVAKDDEISLDLCIGTDEHPKYHLYVVDRETPSARSRKSFTNNRFAVFVVPQGRETEWLFGSKPGRKQLANCANFERLVVAHLSRNHAFTDLDAIKAELSTKVMELAPKNLSKRTAVPFLSIGEGLGQRNLLHKGTSESSGNFVIEDVECDAHVFRRLIFLNNPHVVQSEARLSPSSAKVDPAYLACEHHESMVAAIAFVDGNCEQPVSYDNDGFNILIIGLGGGGLATFLRHKFLKAKVHVVELDESVLELAIKFFDLVLDNRLTVEIAEGLEYVKSLSDNVYDLVMIDVDSKDPTVGMSCPPESFVRDDSLNNFKRILTDRGVFVLNLVCRNQELRTSVVERVKNVFAECRSKKIPEELNEIIYSKKSPSSSLSTSAVVVRERLERLAAHLDAATPPNPCSCDKMMESLCLL